MGCRKPVSMPPKGLRAIRGVSMDKNLSSPHVEANEDGYSSQHPGYRELKCEVCGRVNIQVVTLSAKTTCLGEHKKERV